MTDWMELKGLLSPTCRYGHVIHASDEIPTTQEPAREAALAGEPSGSIWVTDWQTAGRGRRGRTWSAAKGVDITFSLMIRPDIAATDTPLLSLAAGIAVSRAVSSHGIDAQLKWPNDATIGGRKFCGIICDSAAAGTRCAWAVLGIGVNVNREAADLPDPAPDRPQATSILAASGKRLILPELLATILEALDSEIGTIERGGTSEFMARYQCICATVGQDVRVFTDGAIAEGRALRVGDTGELIVLTSDGERSFHAADVIHLR